MRRCAITSGTVASCFSASARNCDASSAYSIAIERHIVRDPKPIENREQQQRVFGWFAEASALSINERARIDCRLGFGRRVAFDMHECVKARPEV